MDGHRLKLATQSRCLISKVTRLPLKFVPGLFMFFCSAGLSAAESLVTPADTNSRVIVENAIVKGDETTVFFLTQPDMGDPNAGKACPLNYYSLTLKPGLASVNIDVMAMNVCSGLLQKSRLLDNGDALMIVGNRLERWRAGEMIGSQAFSSIDATSKWHGTTAEIGAQFFALSPQGDVVLALSEGAFNQNDFPGVSMVVTSLKPDGTRRWEVKQDQQGAMNTPIQMWAGFDGGALIYTSMLASGLSPVAEAQLHFINTTGSKKLVRLNQTGEAPDILNMGNVSMEDVQKLLQSQGQSNAESVKNLGAVPRSDGGFDVLFQLKGEKEGRTGFFLHRYGPDAAVQSEISLGNSIEMHGLERWFDFYIEGNQLVLLSKAPVTQKVVKNVKRKWGQNVVSWIDLDSGLITARLMPLDERYLEAAMSAGDAGQQYLDGQPGSEPVLLTTLGGKPLVVSVGWVSKRQVLRLHEADNTLMAFTEIADERMATMAKEASRKQHKTDREARSQRIDAEMAAAAGMSEEEFGALSNREQKEALVRSGNSDQLLKSMTLEAQAVQAQQATAAQRSQQQQAITPRDMNAQIAKAMAEAQQEMANDPNMTPEMLAQMAAIMAQMGQASSGQSIVMPGNPTQAGFQNAPSTQTAPSPNTLKVDSENRGIIEFKNADGHLTTLLIFNRQTDKELMKKDYPDGVIYEHINFGQFNLPLELIGVIYREFGGQVLEELTPVVLE